MRLGVCGSIGAGKSYVCNLFADLGVPVYNTDENTKKYLYYPLILVKVRKYFGEEIFNGDELDRKKLGEIIFNDKEKMEWLQSLLYPYLGKDLEEWCSKQDFNYVIIESAVFYETGFDEYVDKILVVVAPDDVRKKRVMCRDKVSKDYFDIIDDTQMSQSEKMLRADYVIQNNNMNLIPIIDKIHNEFLR